MNFDLVDYLYSQILKMKVILILFLFFIAGSAAAQLENKSSLSISTIMQGEGFIGNLPHSIQFMPNNNVLFKQDQNNDRVDEHYLLNITTNQVSLVVAEDLALLPEYGVVKHSNANRSFYINNSSLRTWKEEGDSSELLMFELDGIRNVNSVSDSNVIYVQKRNNIYKFYLDKPLVKQVTNFKRGSKELDKQLSEEEHYLQNQQLELFDVLVTAKQRKKARATFNDAKDINSPLEIYYGDDYLNSMSVSPDEKYITFVVSNYPDTEPTHVEEHVTKSGWTQPISARSKIGRKDATHKMGIFNIEANEVVYCAIDNLEGVLDKPEYLQLYDAEDIKYELPKNIVFHGPYFSEKGEAIIEVKSFDNKDRWIAILDMKTGALTQIEHQHDEAWIGGPGISGWKGVPGNIGWLKDNKTIFFQSEETGYSHLYLYDTEKNKKKQLTEGRFEIHSAQLSLDGSKFYVSANKNHAGNREFYHLDIKSKQWTSILTEDGNYEVAVSQDEKYLAYRYSYKNKPWELYVTQNKEGNTPNQVTHSLKPNFDDYNWRAPEVIRFKAEDGANVPARVYKPTAENNNHAAVIFVHGAGYLQNAHNWWSGYYREYMFHNLLVDNGYTVLDIDYRASKGYGRDWRTEIYRYMGGKDLSDQVDGRKYLIEQCGVDSNRVGMYGGSYGGFISIMAMLTTDKFPCAAAIRSVTDWAHYNHDYTSNILNTPVLDSIAYRRSSPIYFAENLQGKLLMLHGMIDDNVQYQDVVRLSQRFIELGKSDWDLVGYPVEPHGFKEPTSWTDEYKRIFKLFQENLR